MLILLSPAKSLNLEPQVKETAKTTTRLDKQSNQIAGKLRSQSLKSLRSMMKISKDLAVLNRDRYKELTFPVPTEGSKSALFLFDGDVYKGIETASLSEEAIDYAQDHVRILSGLYGVLRPLDQIQAYRLEMGTRLPIRKNTNLYQFWGDEITKIINKDIQDLDETSILNLASNEYFDAVKKPKLKARLIDVNFKEIHNGELKFISFNAKRARGMMTRYAIDHSITKIDDMKAFDTEQYSFNEALSTADSWMFTR